MQRPREAACTLGTDFALKDQTARSEQHLAMWVARRPAARGVLPGAVAAAVEGRPATGPADLPPHAATLMGNPYGLPARPLLPAQTRLVGRGGDEFAGSLPDVRRRCSASHRTELSANPVYVFCKSMGSHPDVPATFAG
jgi:hypothetical protein